MKIIDRLNWPMIGILLTTVVLWYVLITLFYNYCLDPIVEFFGHILLGLSS
jgi:hypothetical protein